MPLLHRPLPAADGLLLAAGQRQLFRRDVFGDDRTGADGRTVADVHRGDQRAVRADENAVAEGGAVFVGAVVVAGNRPRANIDRAAEGGVADVAQMIDFAAACNMN